MTPFRALGIAGMLAGCGAAATGGELPRAEATTSEAEREQRFALDFEMAPLMQVARTLGERTGRSVVVGSELSDSDATVTVITQDALDAEFAIDLVANALASFGIVVTATPQTISFHRDVSARPPLEEPAPVAPAPAHVEGSGIERLSDTESTITRARLDALFDDEASLMRAARVIPHQTNGVVDSISIFGLRRSSVLARLGFLNGDRVRRVNGFDLTSPDTALEAYASVRDRDESTVELTRRGQEVTLVIRVVE